MSSSVLCSGIKTCLECIVICFFIERPNGKTECVIDIEGKTVNTVAPGGEDLCSSMYPVLPPIIPESFGSSAHSDLHNVLWYIAYALYTILAILTFVCIKQLWSKYMNRVQIRNVTPRNWTRRQSSLGTVAPFNPEESVIINENYAYFHSMDDFLASLDDSTDSNATEMTIVPNVPMTPERIDFVRLGEDGAVIARANNFTRAYFGDEEDQRSSPIRAAASGQIQETIIDLDMHEQ
ncbi:unnamed protein product [Orchesella dallaii]|uniref:Uncharacterized protein n=1 Tax=Orchesella dallaii TaxID=48710 RepID=A0ABP1QY47_9HEXA